MKPEPCIGIKNPPFLRGELRRNKFRRKFLVCTLLLLLPAGLAFAQTQPTRLQTGVSLYGKGQWAEAAAELRRAYAESSGNSQKAEALYWIALTELAAGSYENSLRAMDEMERISPDNTRYGELPYHRGRALFYLGRYDEAVSFFSAYANSIAVDVPGEGARKPAALYWMGECLYSMGQLDKAQDIFAIIVEQYPQSVKFEASSYRLSLINQKKIEVELLSILKWSHEESLKTVEAYQRRERSYDQAILVYQKRIADILNENGLTDLDASNTNYQRRLAEAEARIAWLEAQLWEAGARAGNSNASGGISSIGQFGNSGSANDSGNRSSPSARLRVLKTSTQNLINEITNILTNVRGQGN
ncbi:hypothetical protein FACS189473_1720 [Spirochaetia bacterium]|nr:hypothetical protein FACS189473_1720 [Spirochaetia bacterium]